MITGTGIDLVDVSRIERILKKWGDRFTEKVFSPAERHYCDKKAYAAIHYAARFAAKESLLKALGMGLGMGIRLKDIEVINDASGRPALVLHGMAKTILREREIAHVHLSLTHIRSHAAAVVILEK